MMHKILVTASLSSMLLMGAPAIIQGQTQGRRNKDSRDNRSKRRNRSPGR